MTCLVKRCSDSCHQDKRALGFQRNYHVTDPFIKRLGLESELQVPSPSVLLACGCLCVRVCVRVRAYACVSINFIILVVDCINRATLGV